jgi:hypothetical protein
MREILRGFLKMRLLAFVPLLIVILVLVGVSALTRGSDALGIAILAGVALGIAALAWLFARRSRSRA